MNWKQILQSVNFPTTAIVLDFEGYHDTECNLKKLSILEYLVHPRFELFAVGISIINQPFVEPNPTFWPQDRIEKRIRRLQEEYGENLERCTIVGQNLRFDCAILAHFFGIIPKYTVDILDLARFYDSRRHNNLANLCKVYKTSVQKGDNEQFKGKKFDEIDIGEMIEYNRTDMVAETELLYLLLPGFENCAKVELPLQVHTLKMYLNPRFEFDYKLASELIGAMATELDLTIRKASWVIKYNRQPLIKTILSNKLFAEILIDVLPKGEIIPLKLGKKNNIPQLAKTDEGFQYLLQHPTEKVRDLCQARLSAKSWPSHILRINSMAAQATARKGKLGIPLNYYGAHTGRFSGTQKINLQNLAGAGRGGQGPHLLLQQMRHLLVAPTGFILGIADLSQIEARITAWIAGQDDLLQGFAKGEDIYSTFASVLFRHPVQKSEDKQMKIERGFGKDAILGCLASGTPILTNNGWKFIENVLLTDKVWDGVGWVNHKGVKYQGNKQCINVAGIWITPEHEILTWDGWTTAAELNTNNQKLAINMENLQLSPLNMGNTTELSPSNVVAPVVEFLLRQEIIWSPENLYTVMSVLKKHPAKLRVIARIYRTPTGQDFLTEFVQSLVDAKQNRAKIMDKEVLEFGLNGLQTELLFLNIWQRYQGGIIQILKSTESITIKDMNLVISDLQQEKFKQEILAGDAQMALERIQYANGVKEFLLDKKRDKNFVQNIVPAMLPTYDIMFAGKNRRYQAGNLLCSNCGFGMGAKKFYERCRANPDLKPLFDKEIYDFDFIQGLIKEYRQTYSKIPEFWSEIEKAFRWVIKYPQEIITAGLRGMFKFWNKNGTVNLQLPSGRVLFYPHASVNKKNEIVWRWGKLWGGSITENVVQSIARDLFAEGILRLEEYGYPVIHHSHDEIVCCLPEKYANAKLTAIMNCMCIIPDWAVGLPVAVEGELTRYYKK